MDILLDNVIPGNHNRMFETNATDEQDLLQIKEAIMRIRAIEKVEIKSNRFPVRITVYAYKLVEIAKIEEAVHDLGFNIIPKQFLSI
ncbi:heavy-metal-associated domain-containing protein [Formosa sp. S-31]|uniref:heavy-metal-associated domain-containing protein n=1 Tax=Formosa sp. S-31 TaxID=2790949 RepID=UPI003EC07FE3